MAVLKVSDLQEAAVKQLGNELGIQIQGKKVTDIQAEIAQKYPNLVLLTAPASPSTNQPTGSKWATGFAVISVALTMFTAIATWIAAESSKVSADAAVAVMKQTLEEKEESKRTSWQTSKIFQILEDGSVKGGDSFQGMTLEDIKTHYMAAGHEPEESVKLNKAEFSDYKLRKILTDLQKEQIVFRSIDNKYVANISIFNTNDDMRRSDVVTRVGKEILKILAAANTIKLIELETKIKAGAKEKYPLYKDEDFTMALFSLGSQNFITIDGQFVSSPLYLQKKSNRPAQIITERVEMDGLLFQHFLQASQQILCVCLR